MGFRPDSSTGLNDVPTSREDGHEASKIQAGKNIKGQNYTSVSIEVKSNTIFGCSGDDYRDAFKWIIYIW